MKSRTRNEAALLLSILASQPDIRPWSILTVSGWPSRAVALAHRTWLALIDEEQWRCGALLWREAYAEAEARIRNGKRR